MENKDNSDKVTVENNGKSYLFISIVLMLIFCTSLVFYFTEISSPDLEYCIGRWDEKDCISKIEEESYSRWGQFGDFIGGTVNPLVGLLTILLLLRTIEQQNASLRQARESIKQTEIALNHANKALEQNEEALKLSRADIKISQEIQSKAEKTMDAQVKMLKDQNIYSNYYAHLKEFEDHTQKLQKKYSNSISMEIDTVELHRYFFPNAKNGSFEIKNEIKEYFYRLLFDFTFLIVNLDHFNDANIDYVIDKTNDYFNPLNRNLRGFLSFSICDSSAISYNTSSNKKVLIHNGTFSGHLNAIVKIIEIYKSMVFFDDNNDVFHVNNLIYEIKSAIKEFPEIIVTHRPFKYSGEKFDLFKLSKNLTEIVSEIKIRLKEGSATP